MEKYRIISENPCDITKMTWYIERKKFWGWKRIYIIENKSSKNLKFDSLSEAELYMYKNYFIDGTVYQPTPNQYCYIKNTYYL